MRSKADWPTFSVEQLAAEKALVINDGYRAKNSELGDVGLPFVRAKNVYRGLQLDDADILDEKCVARAGTKISQPEDVVFTSKGSVGRFAFVRRDTPRFVYSPQLCFWRVLDRRVLDPRFLFFWMQGEECQRQFNALKGQTDMADYISLRDQRAMQLSVPVREEQTRIAGILSALDDKIDGNYRLADLLERAASAMFRAQFVDFVGRGDLGKSNLGLIPEGWRIGVLSDLATVVMGQSPPGSTYADESESGLLLVQGMGGFGDRYPISTTWTSAPTKQVSAGATLMTVRAPVGAVNVARSETCIGRGVASFVSQYPAFTEFHIRSLRWRWASEESGTIFPAVNRKQILGLQTLVPPKAEIQSYEAFARPLVDHMLSLHIEAERLTVLRDLLLPKLVSGQIRTPSATDSSEASAIVASGTAV